MGKQKNSVTEAGDELPADCGMLLTSSFSHPSRPGKVVTNSGKLGERGPSMASPRGIPGESVDAAEGRIPLGCSEERWKCPTRSRRAGLEHRTEQDLLKDLLHGPTSVAAHKGQFRRLK
ncbi:hypothetical protein DV515_00017708, partial [Chloebia gouldiae]